MGSMGGQTEAVAPLQGSDEPQQVHQEHQPPTRATYPEAPHGDATEDEFLSGAGGVKRPAEPLPEEDMPNGLVKVPRVDEGPQDVEEDDDGDDGELATTADQAADFDPFQEPSKPTGGMSHGRWTREEHERFLTGLQMYGRAWRTISKCVVKTRTPEQVRIHAQKYFHKQAQKAKNKHTHDGHWTNEEHELFLDLYDQHGNKWKKIAEIMKTRTNEQVRTHAQKYFAKLSELRDRGYDGQYNMDGKRHLTKSFLQQPGVPAPRPATPPAAASAQAKHWTKPPGAKRSSGQRKRPGRRRRDDDDDDDVIDDDEDDDTGAATPARSRASTGSSKRTPPPDGPRLVTVSTRSGRKATTRKWDEELQDDEDEMDEDDVYQVGAKKGPPMNGGGGAPKADGGDSDDDVIEEEEVEEEEQDDKAAETLLFWQQSQTSGPDSVDGSLTAAPGEEGTGNGSSAAPTGPGEAMPTTTSATSNGMTPQMMMMQPQQLMPLPTPAPQEQCQQQQPPVMVMPPLPPHMAPMQPLDTQHHQTIAEQVMMMMPPTPVAYHDPHHSHHQQQQPQPGGPGEMPSAVQDLMPDPLPSPSAMLQQQHQQHMPPMPHEAMDATALHHHHHHHHQQLMEVPVEQPTMVEVPSYGKDVPEVAALPPQHQQQEQQQQLRVEDEEPAPDSPQSVHELEGAQALLSWQG